MTKDIFKATTHDQKQIEAKIYLGRNIHVSNDGLYKVTDNEIREFFKRTIAPKFEGFNSTTVDGWWKGEEELCEIVSILINDTDNNRTRVRWIAEQYKSRFKQDSVMVSFHACQFVDDVWPHGANAGDYRQSEKTGDKLAEAIETAKKETPRQYEEVVDALADDIKKRRTLDQGGKTPVFGAGGGLLD